MNAPKRFRICGQCGTKAAALLMLMGLAACASGGLFGGQPDPTAPPPPPPPAPPPPPPPPVDLAGRWRLSASPGRACFMNFADTAGPPGASPAPGVPGAPPPLPGGPNPGPAFALQGTIAPEGGCPGNFFTSRKWTFEHGMLIIRDFKSQPLAQLSYSGDRFEGEDANSKLTLSR
jgi:hypothetical protein